MSTTTVDGNWFIIADVHFRHDSLSRNAPSFEWIKERFFAEKPSQVIMCGDQTTNRESISWDTLHAFKDLLDVLVSAPWAPTVRLLVGNHDMTDSQDRTVNSASIIAVGASRIIPYSEITETVIDGCKVLFIPWHADHKEVAVYLAAQYPDRASRQDTVVFAHLALGGTATNVSGRIYPGTELTPDSFSGFVYTFLGHFHKHKTYGENGSVLYVGSPLQNNFNESGDIDKGYIRYKFNERTWALQRNPHAEQFIRLSVPEAEKAIAKARAGHDNAAIAGKMVQLTQVAGVDNKIINAIRKGLQEVAKVGGVAPARELLCPVLVTESTQELAQHKQASRVEILDYAREYVRNRTDWLLEDGDSGKAMLDYVKEKGEQLKREGLEDGSTGCGADMTFVAEVAELHMENFLGISGKRVFRFDELNPGVWLVQGKNGAGKTTLIEAIVWCLYGVCTRGENVNKRNVIAQVVHLDAGNGCSVTVRFANGLRVCRARSKAGKAKLWYEMLVDTTDTTSLAGLARRQKRIEKGTIKDTQSMLEKVLNVDYTTFVNTVLLNASQTQTFANGGDERKKIIDDLLGFSVLEHYGAVMANDNTRVNSELKTCNLTIREGTGKLQVLEALSQRKASELAQRKLDLSRSTDDCSRYESEVAKTERDELHPLFVKRDTCLTALEAIEKNLAETQERHRLAQHAFDFELDSEVAARRSSLGKRIAELQHVVSVGNAHKDQIHDQINDLQEKLDVAEANIEARVDLENRLHQADELVQVTALSKVSSCDFSEKAKITAADAGALVADLERELSRYITTHRKSREQLDNAQDVERCLSEITQFQKDFASSVREYEEKATAKDIMCKASSHINVAVGILNQDNLFWPIEGHIVHDDLKDRLNPSLNAAHETLRGYVDRNDTSSRPESQQSATLDTFRDGSHLQLQAKLTSLQSHDDATLSVVDAASAEEIAKDRLCSCESRLANARRVLSTSRDDERRAYDIACAHETELAKATTVRDMIREQVAEHAEKLGDASKMTTLVRQLQKQLSAIVSEQKDDENDTGGGTGAETELLNLETQVADLSALRASCAANVLSFQDAVASAHTLVTEAVTALRELTDERKDLDTKISNTTQRLHTDRCELARLRERTENLNTDITLRENEQGQLAQEITVLQTEMSAREKQLEEISSQSKIITRWREVWKGKTATNDLQATSFRSFCLERNVSLINDRLAVNINLLNRDANDEAWGQELSCKLDNELRLVETGAGLSLYRMSEGQRKRMQLALFFATFEIAQNRSAFQPRILFLDEVFDALDQDGQIAVQRWITHYANTHQNSKIFVVSHSSTIDGFQRNICGKIDVSYGRDGSQYSVVTV